MIFPVPSCPCNSCVHARAVGVISWRGRTPDAEEVEQLPVVHGEVSGETARALAVLFEAAKEMVR